MPAAGGRPPGLTLRLLLLYPPNGRTHSYSQRLLARSLLGQPSTGAGASVRTARTQIETGRQTGAIGCGISVRASGPSREGLVGAVGFEPTTS